MVDLLRLVLVLVLGEVLAAAALNLQRDQAQAHCPSRYCRYCYCRWNDYRHGYRRDPRHYYRYYYRHDYCRLALI